jgi:hypothetical protein
VNPRRAEEHDGVLDVLRFEAAERLQILRKNPEGTRFSLSRNAGSRYARLGIMMRSSPMRQFDHSLAIEASPVRILDAFFNNDDLAAWWHVTRSLCHRGSLALCARMGGDGIERRRAGRLGGAFRGTVIDFKPGREFFVADAYWLPPTASRLDRWRSK